MAMKTRQQLSAWAMWVFDSKWLYGMGTYGQRLQTIYATLAKSWYYTSKNPSGFKVLTAAYNAGKNPRLYDCHGIVDGFRMDDGSMAEIEFDPSLDISADMEFNRVKNAGKLGVDYGKIDAAMKDNAGFGYWKSGHFGIGVGDGQVVDIWNTGYPARKRDQTLGGWSDWLKCFGINYGEDDDIMLQKGDKGMAVYDYQVAVKALKYDIGNFKDLVNGLPTGCDGDYGNGMVAVTSRLQADFRLPVTGSVDAATYGKVAVALAEKGDSAATVAALSAAQFKVDELTAEVDSKKKLLAIEQGKTEKLTSDLATADATIAGFNRQAKTIFDRVKDLIAKFKF